MVAAHPRIGVAAALAAGLAVLLAGCTTGTAPDVASPAPSVTAPAASATPVPTPTGDPVYNPDGTADDNLAYFDRVNLDLESGENQPSGRKIINNLVDAGFDKSAMEITADKTAINLDTDSIEFTVLIDDRCLFGQFGAFKYRSVVLPVLETGKCLVGKTRSINW